MEIKIARNFGEKFSVIHYGKLYHNIPYVAENKFALNNELVEIYEENVFSNKLLAEERYRIVRITRLKSEINDTERALKHNHEAKIKWTKELQSYKLELKALNMIKEE